MLSCSKWSCAPSFLMGGGLESQCVGRVCGADVAVLLRRSCVRCGCCTTTTAPNTRPTQRLGAENHMLQVNM